MNSQALSQNSSLDNVSLEGGLAADAQPPDLAEGSFRLHLFAVVHGIVLNIVIVGGLMGNVLAFVVLCRKTIRSSATSVYLRLLSVADGLVLFTAIFRYKTYKIFSTHCALYTTFYVDPYVEVYVEPFHWMCLGVSSFTTLALSVERYLAVKFPLVIKHTAALTGARVVMGIQVLVVVCLTIPNIASYTVDYAQFLNMTIAVAMKTEFGASSQYSCNYHEYIIPIAWYLLPCCILTTLNHLLCLKVRQSGRLRVGQFRAKRNRNLTVLVISIIAVYILCNLPRCILVFYRLVNFPGFCEETKTLFSPTPRSYLVTDVVSAVLNVMNSCLNIIIYCIVGRKFRQELKRVIMCHRWKFRAKVAPTVAAIAQRNTSFEMPHYEGSTCIMNKLEGE